MARYDGGGTRTNDIFTGTDERDLMIGRGGDDLLIGGGNNDFQGGNANDDTLNGGSGNDRLIGGAGSDVLTGGIGEDRFIFTNFGKQPQAVSVDTITDFSGAGDAPVERFTFSARSTLPESGFANTLEIKGSKDGPLYLSEDPGSFVQSVVTDQTVGAFRLDSGSSENTAFEDYVQLYVDRDGAADDGEQIGSVMALDDLGFDDLLAASRDGQFDVIAGIEDWTDSDYDDQVVVFDFDRIGPPPVDQDVIDLRKVDTDLTVAGRQGLTFDDLVITDTALGSLVTVEVAGGVDVRMNVAEVEANEFVASDFLF